MALITSHTLNSLDGTHASGIAVTLTAMPSGKVLFATHMDEGGRLREEVDLSRQRQSDRYELVFDTGTFWAAHQADRSRAQIMSDIVVRLIMPDPVGHYHIPLIISPNGHSMWWSS